MPEPGPRLGINIDANKLFYAVSNPEQKGSLTRIGSIDFPFDLPSSLAANHPETLPGVSDTICKLTDEYEVQEIRVILPPVFECWSMIPKIVCDDPKECEIHITILTKDSQSFNREPHWFPLSNRDFKLLCLRKNQLPETLASISGENAKTEILSDFEIGSFWMKHQRYHGSFLCLSSYNGLLSISSFLLGKLRAATYIRYEDIHDLPYLWLQYASHLPWIEGLHEQVLLYGDHSEKISDTLRAHLDDSTEVVVMNSLKKMNLKSDEQTYSFPLERAFPAALICAV